MSLFKGQNILCTWVWKIFLYLQLYEKIYLLLRNKEIGCPWWLTAWSSPAPLTYSSNWALLSCFTAGELVLAKGLSALWIEKGGVAQSSQSGPKGSWPHSLTWEVSTASGRQQELPKQMSLWDMLWDLSPNCPLPSSWSHGETTVKAARGWPCQAAILPELNLFAVKLAGSQGSISTWGHQKGQSPTSAGVCRAEWWEHEGVPSPPCALHSGCSSRLDLWPLRQLLLNA